MTTLIRPSQPADPGDARQAGHLLIRAGLIDRQATRCGLQRGLERCLERLNSRFRRWRDEDL